MNIVSGEKFQELADVYLGLKEDFNYNSNINKQVYKHKNISEINSIELYDNPYFIFCYSNRINILADKINHFKNDFILITHNSDENIVDNIYIQKIYNCEKLIKWFSQNLCYTNDKMCFLPIGIANQQWEHGVCFNNFYNYYINNIHLYPKKYKNIYFFFKIDTNKTKRKVCFDLIKNKVPFLNQIKPKDNFIRMSEYEFCICPEGNGIDTHRFWEALYLRSVPIVLKNPLIEIINKNTNLPIIILNSWDEFNIDNLPEYNTFDFEKSNKYLDLNYYINLIKYNK